MQKKVSGRQWKKNKGKVRMISVLSLHYSKLVWKWNKMTLFLEKPGTVRSGLFIRVNKLPAAMLRLKLSAVGNASEVGYTCKISWEYPATTMLKWVHSLPFYCAFSQLCVHHMHYRIIWTWEMHRNQSIELFTLDLWKLKLAIGYNIHSQETDVT